MDDLNKFIGIDWVQLSNDLFQIQMDKVEFSEATILVRPSEAEALLLEIKVETAKDRVRFIYIVLFIWLGFIFAEN